MPSKSTPQARTRGFTGCYTCRDRRVKCDDTRPICKRCVALHIKCKGYSVKLSWQSVKLGGWPIRELPAAKRRKDSDGTEDAHCRRPLFTDAERKSMASEIQRMRDRNGQILNVDQAIDEVESRSLMTQHPYLDDSTFILGSFGLFPSSIAGSSDGVAARGNAMQDAIDSEAAMVLDGGSEGGRSVSRVWPRLSDEDSEESEIVVSGQDLRPAMDFDLPQDLPSEFEPGFVFPEFLQEPIFWAHPGDMNTPTNILPWDEGELDFRDAAAQLQRSSSALSLRHTAPGPIDLPASLSNSKNLSMVPPEARFLLDHYSTSVIDFIAVLPGSESPWRTIHLPCAMNTFAELMIWGDTSHTKKAFFYALLAVSSYHLGAILSKTGSESEYDNNSLRVVTNGTSQHWINRGLEFRELAVNHIQECLQSSTGTDSQEIYTELLMSLLSMVTISVTSGDMCDAHSYLSKAKRLIYTYGLTRLSKTRQITALHQIFSYVQIIENSTFVSPQRRHTIANPQTTGNSATRSQCKDCQCKSSHAEPHTLSPKGIDALDEDTPESQPFARIYGVPRSLWTLISHTSDLANELEAYHHNKTTTPVAVDPGFQRGVQLLEDKICTWVPPDNNSSQTSGYESDHEQIAHHLISAIHAALIVMFYRRVRRVNPVILQHYIATAAEHLLAQEELKSRKGVNSSAVVWPWFIVACEAMPDLPRHGISGRSSSSPATDTDGKHAGVRGKLLRWMGFARRYGMRHLDMAEKIVREVWRRRDDGIGYDTATWVEVVEEWGINLVLT